MKNNLKIKTALFSAFSFWALTAKVALAQIKNPVIDKDLGDNVKKAESGVIFTKYFVYLWNTAITFGALIVIGMFVFGTVEWITSGGDSGKVDKARQKIFNSAIGLFLLVGSFTLIGFLGKLLFDDNFDILKLTFPGVGNAI
ncbi:MAG: hypothetical protein ACOZAN_01490 [Patescibacteria group bacterium]